MTRALIRSRIEQAIEAALDTAHQLLALLDNFDGDPDIEPDADREDGGDFEPLLAALVGATDSQLSWAGFDQGAAA